jgi:RNA polymerase sigma factor (sigma-70 family)
MNDAGLVVEARAGNLKAFGALYDRHAGGVHDFLRSVTGDDALARDALHDTFVIAGSRLLQLPQPAKLRPWLYAIARRQALHGLARRRRWKPWRRRKGAAKKGQAAAGRRGPTAPTDERGHVARALSEVLGPKERVVLDLHLRHGMDGRQLAEVLGVTAAQASAMARRVRERAEREVGVRVVARTGRQECPQLAKILTGRRGRLRRPTRRRVVRHVDSCRTCRERRRKVATPLALMSAVPPMSPPGYVRDLVLEHVQLGGHKGRSWRASRGGFPPPMVRPRQRRVGLGAAAVAVVLVAVGAVLLLNRDGDDTQQVATEGSPTTIDFPVSPDELPPLGDDPLAGLPPEAGLDDLGGMAGLGDDGSGDGGSAGGGGRGGRGGGGGTGAGGGAPGGDSDGGGGGEGDGGTDTGQPSLGRVALHPGQIVEDEGAGGCARFARSITTRVTATPADLASVRSMTVSWGGPRSGSSDMVPNDEGGYDAVIGPFDAGAVGAGQTVDVSVTVKSVDAAGKTAEHTTSFTLRSCD